MSRRTSPASLRSSGPYGAGKENAMPKKARKPGVTEVEQVHCEGCFHFVRSGNEPHCDYIGNVGHMRPCPAGRDCTEYITPEEWHANYKRIRAEFNEYFPELYGRKKHAE